MDQNRFRGRMAWLVTVACGAAALASGCEKITEKVTQKVTESALEHTLEEQTGAKVDLNSDGKGSISVKSDKGSLQFSGAGGKIPDNWPQDVPVYPGAKVETSISNDAVQMVSVSTTDSPDQAVEFYKQKFAAFKLESTGTNQQQTLSSYRDPGGRRIQVAVGKERSGAGPNTQIALILSRVNKPSAH